MLSLSLLHVRIPQSLPPSSALAVALLAIGILPVRSSHAQAGGPDGVIRRLRTVSSRLRSGPSEVEIEVHGKEPFVTGGLGFILRIGNREFTRYRYPKGLAVDALIFTVPAGEFARTLSGEPVTVYYGTPARQSRSLGRLNKALLDRR